MDGVRQVVDTLYSAFRPQLFSLYPDGEKAHHRAIRAAQFIDRWGGAKLLFDNKANREPGRVSITNAAGSNKNADIPPAVLSYLGFDMVTIGTVTNEAYPGNDASPRVWRFPPGSLVNWMNLPGIGSKAVRENLSVYRDQIFDESGNWRIRIRGNVMATPNKKSIEEKIDDILATIEDIDQYVYEYEINISCPNKPGETAVSSPTYAEDLSLLQAAITFATRKPVYFKLSPDISPIAMSETLDVSVDHPIAGFTNFNTTINPDRKYIQQRPIVNGAEVGGASGDALYKLAFKQHRALVRKIQEKFESQPWQLNAVGAINSVNRVNERINDGQGRVRQIQFYTGGIYKGPLLARELRQAA